MKKKIYILSIILAAILLAIIYRHETKQDQSIKMIEEQITALNQKVDFSEKVSYQEDAFNYLAIGNSITKHGVCEYWWNEIGMAATKRENDYFHLLCKMIEQSKDISVVGYAYNFAVWETQAHDRAQCLSMLDPYLSGNLDLVTIQLSENANNLDTFEVDFEELINYIQKKASKAQVIVVGDFWDEIQKDELKKNAAEKCGANFVSLNDIKENVLYQAGLGTVVYDGEGKSHTIEHEGVARHPGDKGMEYIAEEVFSVVR